MYILLYSLSLFPAHHCCTGLVYKGNYNTLKFTLYISVNICSYHGILAQIGT